MSNAASPASTAVLVLGMHRSGTSALAAALQRLGASLGGELVPANDDNPGGYFENAAAVTAHEALLAGLGRGWEDVRELPGGWLRSDAGRQASQVIAALLREEFATVPLWALKDPRLCRLLPLWRPLLAEAGVAPAYLFMLRHPDEVAASLRKRDGLGEDHAYLLWLRHFLDAERDTRGLRRHLLTYDALLAEPAASLARAGEALGIHWPQAPTVDVLAGVLDAKQRHHRSSGDAAADGSPRAVALALYRAAVAGEWPGADVPEARMGAWIGPVEPWLQGYGDALARERRSRQAIQQRVFDTDRALETAESLSLARMDEARALDARLQSTDAALDEAKALSLSRLDEVEALGARLASTDAALDEAKALSLSRLEELQALNRRLASTNAALDEAKGLSLSRLDEVKALGARLASTDAALEEAKALSLSRLEEVQALHARVQATDAGLAEATRLSLERLEQLHALDTRMGELQRQAEALERQRQQGLLLLEECTALLEQTRAALGEQTVRADAVEADIRALLASRSWRVTAPLRWLARKLGRGGTT